MRALAACLFIALAGLNLPSLGAPPDPRQVLERAIAAAQAVKAVRYEAQAEAEGGLAGRVATGRGSVALLAVAGEELPKLRLEAQIVPPGQTEPVRLQLANDGTFVALAEHGQKIFLRRALPSGAALLNNVWTLLVREFAADRPFERESKALSLEYVGTEKVSDVECDVIHAVLAEDGGEVRWYFGQVDHLPRRVQRIIETPAGRATLTTTIWALQVDPDLEAGVFHLEKPAGFRDPAAGGLLEVGSAAPDWTLKTLEGKEVSLRSLRGRVVLLDFWATWCGPCLIAMPVVQKLYERYKDRPVAVFGINCWERDPRVDPAGFMKAHGFTYPLLVKGDKVATAYQVEGLPTLYVIGPDGRILMARSGISPTTERDLEALIARVLKTLP